MYFYRARYYDPRAGRFLTKDPIGFGGGDVNLYRYVRNNPVNFNDPAGLFYGRTTVEIAFEREVLSGNIAEAKFIAEAAGLTFAAMIAAQGRIIAAKSFEGPDDPTDPREWEKWAKERDERISKETCPLTETPWQGLGKQFDPNEPPEGPWWKKIAYIAGRILKLIQGWPK